MPQAYHLLDDTYSWEQRLSSSQLHEHLSRRGWNHEWAALSGAPFALPGKQTANRIGLHAPLGLTWPLDFFAARTIGRRVLRRGVDLIHAWGIRAAAAACLGLHVLGDRSTPLVIHLFDPAHPLRDWTSLRTATNGRNCGFACSSGTVRRRLIERGLPAESSVVIRPGVDFGVLQRARQAGLRRTWGLAPDDRVAILPEPAARRHGFAEAFFAGVLVAKTGRRVRVLLPGKSREVKRIARFAEALPARGVLMTPPTDCRFEDMLAVSDVLIVPARGDISTTAISWAMAAGVTVIAAAEYATAELIVHKVNGLLFKAGTGRSMAVPMARLLRDLDSTARLKEAARGQAYEVFSVRRYVEQHQRLFENLKSGRPAADGIVDSAVPA